MWKRSAYIFGIVILLLLLGVTVVFLRRGAGREERIEENIAIETEPEPAIQTAPEPPSPSREELIAQLIGTRTGETYSDKKESLLEQLAGYSERDAAVWEAILAYWERTEESGFVRTYDLTPSNPLPEGLPTDKSLCIVVLGYALNGDGSIRQELVDRLTTAYLCAQQYPEAYVLTTGGATAAQNPQATEAEAMADWLVERGLAPERLIVENASRVTYENASFSCEILTRQYPEISSLVIVSSDYHITMGCLLFEAQSLLDTYEVEGVTKLHVVGNVGCHTDGRYFFDRRSQGMQLRGLSY